MYAKFISDSKIELPPKNRGNIFNYNQNTEIMEKDGYRPLVSAPIPEGMIQPVKRYRPEAGKIVEYYIETYVEPVPTEREKALAELQEVEVELISLDYIGVKIATGRATIEEYAPQIARMSELAARKNELKAIINY